MTAPWGNGHRAARHGPGDTASASVERAVTFRWRGLEIRPPGKRGLTVPELRRFLDAAEAEAAKADIPAATIKLTVTTGRGGVVRRAWAMLPRGRENDDG